MQQLYGENHTLTSVPEGAVAVRCHNGTFVGQVEEGVVSYKGIPYASRPERWRKAELPADDARIREAYYFGHAALQTEWESEDGSFYPQSEDCLFVNVWNNLSDTSGHKPVMVFIHGGSYAWGGPQDPLYMCQNLAKRYPDVLFVTLSYRLNLLGFVDFSSVPGGEDYAYTGSLGLQDQLCALKWLQRNLHAFGGDAANVTIWGESAGGGSVTLLPFFPESKGLFRRIISESGFPNFSFSRKECQSQTRRLLQKSGCRTMQELVALPEAKIRQLVSDVEVNYIFPERDGILLPEDPYAAYDSVVGRGFDMLIGSNKDEVRYWLQEAQYMTSVNSLSWVVFNLFGRHMYRKNLSRLTPEHRQIAKQFVHDTGLKRAWGISEFYNEVLFRLPMLRLADMNNALGGRTFVYYWSRPSGHRNWGACHAVELSSVFNNLQNPFCTGGDINPVLAHEVQDMWVNFARTGNPSTPNYTWPAYTDQEQPCMILDDTIRLEHHFMEQSRRTLVPLLPYYMNGNFAEPGIQ